MKNLIHVTTASNLAVHALGYLASRKDDGLCSASEIAEYLRVSEAHLAKVLQRLATHRLIRSMRGAHGGFALTRDPAEIPLLEVLETIDGPMASDSCLLGQSLCRPGSCLFQSLSQIIRVHLEQTTIEDFNPKRKYLQSQSTLPRFTK
ncbi:MAG: Rrf2 family transcriptional regulator [Pseudomonadota bacterium]